MVEDYQTKIIMLMHEQEKLLAELYSVFSELFPEDKEFWEHLVKVELGHAEAIRTLYKRVYEDKLSFEEGKTKIDAIQAVMDFTRGLIASAKKGKWTRVKALSTAKSLENSLLEKNWFAFFKSSSLQFNRIMQNLSDETTNHANMVEKRLAQAAKDEC